MPRFLLWNVKKKPLAGHVVKLVQAHDVDALLLVEKPEPDLALRQVLRTLGFTVVPSCDRFGLYSRLGNAVFTKLTPPQPNDRMDFWRFQLSGTTRITLVAVHGLDRYNEPKEETRRLFFENVHENVKAVETIEGHKRTAVLGDYNANPFEESVGGVQGLHAISVKHVGGLPNRIVLGNSYPFFYNPMWFCYGEGRSRPQATYYFNGSNPHEVFWHMIDQIVMRPELLPFFPESRLRILTRAGSFTLLTTRGYPDSINASDHLPVLFHLNQRIRRKNRG